MVVVVAAAVVVGDDRITTLGAFANFGLLRLIMRSLPTTTARNGACGEWGVGGGNSAARRARLVDRIRSPACFHV